MTLYSVLLSLIGYIELSKINNELYAIDSGYDLEIDCPDYSLTKKVRTVEINNRLLRQDVEVEISSEHPLFITIKDKKTGRCECPIPHSVHFINVDDSGVSCSPPLDGSSSRIKIERSAVH